MELHKRFQLKVEEYVITLVDGQDIYEVEQNQSIKIKIANKKTKM